MKKITSLLLVALMLLSLVACGGTTYKNDVPVDQIAETAIKKLTEGTIFNTAADGFLDDYFKKPDYVESFVIRNSGDTNNLDEFGIFHVEEGKEKDMSDLLKSYLSKSYEANKSFYDSYIPEETPKLRDAEVKTFGNYIVYAIMSEDSRALLFASIESSLK